MGSPEGRGEPHAARQETIRGRRCVAAASRSGSAAVSSRAKALERLRFTDLVFHQLTRAAAIARAGHSRRRHRLAVHRLAAGAPRLRFQLPDRGALEPGHREVRRHRADLRHDRHLVHRDADRGAGRAHDRDVPHRALSHVAAASDRDCDRAARRHPQHHLRHLGPVRVRPVPAADAAAIPDHGVRRHPDPVFDVRGAALRHRRADLRADPRHHGASVHHLDFARRVRARSRRC